MLTVNVCWHGLFILGRAGRDGGLSLCHTFLHDTDFINSHSLSHSTGIAASQVQYAVLEVNVTASRVVVSPCLPACLCECCTHITHVFMLCHAMPPVACTLQIRGLLQMLVDQDPRNRRKDVVALPGFKAYEGVVAIERCALELDIPRAVVETILTFLSQVCEQPTARPFFAPRLVGI